MPRIVPMPRVCINGLSAKYTYESESERDVDDHWFTSRLAW